ncbi:MAG: hypothetical protein ABIH38_01290 [Patescibacteria group bacterium]
MKRILFIVIISTLLITGCSLSINTKSSSNLGVYKSENFADSWQQKVNAGVSGKKAITISGLSVNKIIFDPLTLENIYLLTTDRGIYVSHDKGELWQSTALNQGSYVNLGFDPENSDILYTAYDGRIIKSVNGGKSWQTLYFETQAGQHITDLAVDHSQGKVIYATTNTGALIKSEDYGTTWQIFKRFGKTYINRIILDPRDSKIIYIVISGKGIYRTDDGGVNWQLIAESLKDFPKALNINGFSFFPKNPDVFLITTDYGLLISENKGGSFKAVTTLLTFGTKIDKAIFDSDNSDIIYIVKDNKLHKTENGGNKWQTILLPTDNSVSDLKIYPDPEKIKGSVLYLTVKKAPKKK